MEQKELEAKIMELLSQHELQPPSQLEQNSENYLPTLEKSMLKLNDVLIESSETLNKMIVEIRLSIPLLKATLEPELFSRIYKEGLPPPIKCIFSKTPVQKGILSISFNDIPSIKQYGPVFAQLFEQTMNTQFDLVLLKIAQQKYQSALLDLTKIELFSDKEKDHDLAAIYLTINDYVHAYRINFMNSRFMRLDFDLPKQDFHEQVNLQNRIMSHAGSERVYFASNPSNFIPEPELISYIVGKLQQEYENRNPEKSKQIQDNLKFQFSGISRN